MPLHLRLLIVLQLLVSYCFCAVRVDCVSGRMTCTRVEQFNRFRQCRPNIEEMHRVSNKTATVHFVADQTIAIQHGMCGCSSARCAMTFAARSSLRHSCTAVRTYAACRLCSSAPYSGCAPPDDLSEHKQAAAPGQSKCCKQKRALGLTATEKPHQQVQRRAEAIQLPVHVAENGYHRIVSSTANLRAVGCVCDCLLFVGQIRCGIAGT